jgi:hypothetical protein
VRPDFCSVNYLLKVDQFHKQLYGGEKKIRSLVEWMVKIG